MKQTSRIISTYSADTFGVCSALFELGGMVVMHDASGCNSTYTTHDEPRWFNMDSMVYISALTEMEAIMGDDEKLISDIVTAAEELKPKFIAIVGTPIPTMVGFDFDAVANLIEDRTGIPTFGFATTGMNTYVHGVSMALEMLARHFVADTDLVTEKPYMNILGLTPLDFSVNGQAEAIIRWAQEQGYEVLSSWAMGSSLGEIARAGEAHMNLVVSAGGLKAAKLLEKRFGTPYLVGVPMDGNLEKSDLPGEEIVVAGEGVYSLSLAWALERKLKRGVRVICTTECDENLLRPKDEKLRNEAEIEKSLQTAKIIIADPLYRPICPETAKFVSLPQEAFSGRIYRTQIPDLVADFESFAKELME